jgi:adenylate kinase family enzyme
MKPELVKGKIDNILVMGKSGAGKQPRIDVLIAEYGLKQLSTGDIFRSYLKAFDEIGYQGNIMDFYNSDTDSFIPDDEIEQRLRPQLEGRRPEDVILGLKAKYYVSNGLFVPDSVTNNLFLAAFRKMNFRGIVHDGYPRTVDQAEFLISVVEKENRRIDAIIHVDNDDETILNRVTGRRVCPNCRKVFHMEYKPLKDGKYCTNCGTEAVTRIDDTREKVLSRLKEYREKTQYAIEYLISRGVSYVAVPGNLPELTDEAVRKSVFDAIADSENAEFRFEEIG